MPVGFNTHDADFDAGWGRRSNKLMLAASTIDNDIRPRWLLA